MKFNFLFLWYTVIYAKYNYCYDVPKDMPTRYFDGKEWKLIKTRHHFKTKAPNILNIISKELDWTDLIKEMKDIELVENAPEVTEITFAIKETTTPKNSLFKMAATPKRTVKILRRPTQPSTIKTTVNHSPNTCQLKFTTTTKKNPEIWETKNTTKKCPYIRPTKTLVTTKIPANITEAQGNAGNVSENWSNLLKEFLKFVELKKCEPPCKPESRTSNTQSLLADNRRAMSYDDDLMNILKDGVEIDDRLSEDDAVTSQRELVPLKDKLEDQSQILDFEPEPERYEQEFSGDNVQNRDVKSNEVSIRATKKRKDKTVQSRKQMEYLKKIKAKTAEKDYVVPPIRRSEVYLDKLNNKWTKTSDDIVKSSEIKYYFETLQAMHVKKENDPSEDKGMQVISDEGNYSHSRKEQNKDIRKHINDQYLYGQNDEDNLLDFSKDTLNSKDLNEITDDMAPKHTYSTEVQTNDEDVYQERDITFDLETLESDDVGPDKYSTENNFIQGGEAGYGINEQKDDITKKNYKDHLNSIEF